MSQEIVSVGDLRPIALVARAMLATLPVCSFWTSQLALHDTTSQSVIAPTYRPPE